MRGRRVGESGFVDCLGLSRGVFWGSGRLAPFCRDGWPRRLHGGGVFRIRPDLVDVGPTSNEVARHWFPPGGVLAKFEPTLVEVAPKLVEFGPVLVGSAPKLAEAGPNLAGIGSSEAGIARRWPIPCQLWPNRP